MLSDLRSALRPALVLTLLFTLLLGLAYPLALTGIGQALFPYQANGSLVREDGRVIGSALIGQAFASDRYFHGRPSAAGANGYDAAASAGSNLGPASKALAERVRNDAQGLAALAPGRPVPPDLVTTEGAGFAGGAGARAGPAADRISPSRLHRRASGEYSCAQSRARPGEQRQLVSRHGIGRKNPRCRR